MKRIAQSTRSGIRHATRDWLAPTLLASGLLALMPVSQAASPSDTLREATEKATQIETITGNTPTGKAPAGDPCALLPAADVKNVFPSIVAPERSRRLEKYGIGECIWKGANGQILLVVQESVAPSARRARDEVLSMADGFVDPLKPAARKNLRIETFTTPGVDNAAFVETTDKARGILSDGAYLALIKGRQVITLASPELPSRDRSSALKALENLSSAAAKSMK